MYRHHDSDGEEAQASAEDVAVPQAQPADQADPTELQRAEADSPAPVSPAAAPRDPAAPTIAEIGRAHV